jgi:hypothetical protein
MERSALHRKLKSWAGRRSFPNDGKQHENGPLPAPAGRVAYVNGRYLRMARRASISRPRPATGGGIYEVFNVLDEVLLDEKAISTAWSVVCGSWAWPCPSAGAPYKC